MVLSRSLVFICGSEVAHSYGVVISDLLNPIYEWESFCAFI